MKNNFSNSLTLHYSLGLLKKSGSQWKHIATVIFFILVLVNPMQAQQAPSSFVMSNVDAVQLNQDGVPGFGNNYPTDNTYNLRFGQTPDGNGQGENLRVSSFVFNGDTYTNILPPTVESPYEYVIVNRVNNANVSYDKVTAFFSRSQALSGTIADGTTLYYDPDYSDTMEGLINSFNANQGSDNLFANANSQTINNIERIDLILFQAGVSTTAPGETGFLLMERGGNDNYKAAAITGLNPDGTVSSLGTLITANHTGGDNVWGNTGQSILTTVFQSVASGNPPLLRPSQNLGSQNIFGSYISFGNLGIASGEIIYGIALFPGDVDDTMDLIGLTDVPLDTDGSSASTGGLDFMAGGGFFVDDESTIEFSVASLTEGPCYRTLSSPVSGISYATLLDDFWTQGIEGSKNSDAHPSNANVFVLNENGDDWEALANMNNTIPAGTGFLISVFDQDGTGTIPADPWPKILSASGTENAAPVIVGGLPANSSASNGFAILGNPFKSPINLGALTRVNVRDAFYVYDRNKGGTTNGNQGGWQSWTTDGAGDITDGIIRPYQGFVVQTNVGGEADREVTFPEAAKTTGGVFYGKRQALQNYIRLEAGNEYLYNSMWVRFSENGSNGHGQGDALEMSPMTADYLMLGSRKSKSGETLFDIGHFPMPDPDTEIPVGFEATQPGSYVIRATQMDFSAGWNLYFNDRQTGKSLLIDESFHYEFTNDRASKSSMAPITCGDLHPRLAKTSSMDDRFYISLSPMERPAELPAAVALAQNFPNPFNPSTVIRFEVPESGHVRLAVYDMLGRQVEVLVDENRWPGSYEVVWDAARISSGTYVYRLETNGVAINRIMTLVR